MVMKTVRKTEVPAYVSSLFQEPQCEHIKSDVGKIFLYSFPLDCQPPSKAMFSWCISQSAPFWLLLRAIRNFVYSPSTNSGSPLLPLSGSLPDMKATSSGYSTLVALYRSKAKEDLASVRTELSNVLQHAGLPDDGSVVDEEMLSVFVKNVAFLKVVRGRRMRDEYERPDRGSIRKATHFNFRNPYLVSDFETTETALAEATASDPFTNADSSPVTNVHPIHFYLALRASDTFHVEHSRWPGSLSSDLDSDGQLDMAELLDCTARVVKICVSGEETETGKAKVDEQTEKACSEMCVPLHLASRHRIRPSN